MLIPNNLMVIPNILMVRPAPHILMVIPNILMASPVPPHPVPEGGEGQELRIGVPCEGPRARDQDRVS